MRPQPRRGASFLFAVLAVTWTVSCSPGVAPDWDPTTDLDAEIVLDLSIAFHDPEGLWSSGTFCFALEESRPDGTVRSSRILLRNADRHFELETERDGRAVVLRVDVDEVTLLADGEPLTDPTAAEDLGFAADQAGRLRDYYLYLYGLPMKLRDPGTRLDPVARRRTFQGRDALELQVTYDPEVGSDVWAFFVDPIDYSLIGYRFDHAPGADDGETIVLEELAQVHGLRLPRIRRWTTNRGDRYLGTDTIVADDRPGDEGRVARTSE